MNPIIRARRLFVSGGSRLTANAALLWQKLGRLLAEENGLIVLTGGLENRMDNPAAQAADYMVINGMLSVLSRRGVPPEEHIETYLPDSLHDWNRVKRFNAGRIHVLTKRNAQSRRFSMVQSADVVISIEGERGTRSVLDVALAIDRPILPLPFGGGVSREVWDAQREDILKWFRISPGDAESFEKILLAELGETQIEALAGRVRDCLMKGFTQGCFVIMRFHEESDPVYDKAIRPALEVCGFQAWRTDRSVPTGDIIEAIRDGINHCYFAIVDTTEDRPNVMYELGLAHATGKPVILLRKANPDGSLPEAPFDFQTKHILKYTDDFEDLRRRLETAIGVLSGKISPKNDF
jgi:predicted Rossmann-fold nucleotide-binding protein